MRCGNVVEEDKVVRWVYIDSFSLVSFVGGRD